MAGAWLARSQDVLSDADRAVDVSLDDCCHTLCVEIADVIEGGRSHDVTSDGVWQYAVTPLRCATCKAFLGVKAPPTFTLSLLLLLLLLLPLLLLLLL